jgi:hypothetical protein
MLSDKAKNALANFYDFGVEYWKLDLEEKPHREMCNIVQAIEDDPDTPYGMSIVPRGCYKTSIGRAAAVWMQLRQIFLFDNVYHRIMLTSAVLAHSESGLRLIEGQLRTNQDLIKDFGKLFIEHNGKGAPSSRHPDGLMLAPRIQRGEIAAIAEPSFWVGSIRRVSTGFHADGAVVDDLNNKENTATDFQREKTKTYWELIFPIIGRTDRQGRPCKILMNATPWHDDDVRGSILRKEREREASDSTYKSKWTVLHKPAVDDAGVLFWPTKLGEKELEELRDNMSVGEYSANYLCDPVGKKGFVSEDEIIFKSREEFPELKQMRLCVDPSQHTKAKALGCYCAMVVAGYDKFSNLYFVDASGSREWDSAEMIAELFRYEEVHPNIPILVEDKHMAHFDHAIHLEEQIRSATGVRKTLRIQYVPAESETKYEKWMKLQPRFRSHRVIIASEIAPKIKGEIKEELLRGTVSRFKDFLDAMAIALYGVRPKVARDVEQGNVVQMMPKGPATFAQMVPGVERYFPK